MINNRKSAWCRAGVLAALAALVWIASAPRGGQAGSGAEPQYASNGDLLVPVGFERWLFVGSNLGLGYNNQTPKTEFHNIYLSPGAYEVYRVTGQFRDGTVLVMQKFAAADREPMGVLTKGVYNGLQTGVEVAVKNSHRPVRPSSMKPWAYYDFTDDKDPSKVKSTAGAFDDATCERCHQDHNANTDNVWVPFYPILRSARP
jgi:hypothetical protein